MRETEYRILHGWVEDIERHPRFTGEYRLVVRLEEGRVQEFVMGLPSSPLRLGDEVGVAVSGARPGRVLAIVDRSTGEGSQFLRGEGSRWFTEADLLVIAAVAGSFAVALQWMALPALAAFALVYGMVRRQIQKMRRQRAAARIDYLLDKDYFRWRAGLDRRWGAP